MGGVIEPGKVQVVAASLVEVDAALWDATRLAVPADERSFGPSEGRIFPVVARAGRLLLLSGFEEFLAAVDAGATFVTVWRAEIQDGESLEATAVLFSLRFGDSHRP
jgi:hypothetical protein